MVSKRDWTGWRLETEVGSGAIRLPLLGLRRVSSIPAQLVEISSRLARLEAALLAPESAEARMRSQSSTPAVGMDWGGTNPGSASVGMPTRGPVMTRDTGGFADAIQSSPSAG